MNNDRRQFIAGSLTTGFVAAVAPTGDLLAQVIATDTQGLVAGEVQIMMSRTAIPAYRAQPAGKTNLPIVLVVQEIFGVHEYIKDVCRRFAKQGYMAVAVEHFHRQGRPNDFPDAQAIIANIVGKVPDSQVMSDLDTALAWAGTQGGDVNKAAVTGFCWGGRITWLYAAHNPKLKAGVAWYGRLSGQINANNPLYPIEVAEKMHAPVLGLYGGKDTGIPLSNVDEMKTRLSFGTKASEASDIIVYPDAPHAFHADYRPSYRKADAEDGWQRCISWFKNKIV